MKKIKLFSLVIAIVVAICSLVSCEDKFTEDNNKEPIPAENRMDISGVIDFFPENSIGQVYIFLVDSVVGTGYVYGPFLYQGITKNFSFSLGEAFNYLNGTCHDVLFSILYEDEGGPYVAELIVSVNFSRTVNLGNVGFGQYNWLNSNPRLRIVIEPTGAKGYYISKAR